MRPTDSHDLRRPLAALPTHLLRELRDQRSILLGVFLALPVLNLLAFWAFADRLVEAPVDTAAGGVPPIALGLFLLAVVGDVFAGESRRGTLAFLRRLPGGMRQAFTAKVLVTLVGSALTVVWQALLLWGCWWLWSRSYVPTPGGVIHAALTSPLLLPAVVAGAFVLLASTWLQHGGMAILLAPMLLGALIAPAVVWGRANLQVVRWALGSDPWDVVLPVAIGVAGTALLASAASFLAGRRVVRSAWSAAWRGLVVLLVVSGGAYAYGGWRLHEALDFRPGEEDAVITQAWLGRGGRTLFVEACNERRGAWQGSRYATLSRVWAVDLPTGAMHAIGELGDTLEQPPHAGRWGTFPSVRSSYAPLSSYVQRRVDAEGREVEVWLDGRTGETRKVVRAGVRTPDVLAWMDETAAEASRTFDDHGRRIWIRSLRSGDPRDPFGRPALCVEGGAPTPLGDDALRIWQAYSQPGGWVVRPSHARTWAVVDARDGSLRASAVDFARPLVLSPTRCLWRGWTGKGNVTTWQLTSLGADGASGPAPGLDPAQADVVGVLDVDCVLTLHGPPKSRRLCTWDPDTGTHEPIAWSAPEASPLESHRLRTDVGYAAAVGYTEDGSLLVHVGWGASEATSNNVLGVIGFSLVSVDRATRVVTCVVPTCSAYPRVVAYEQGGAVSVVEQGRRIVRWGPGTGERQVLFPR